MKIKNNVLRVLSFVMLFSFPQLVLGMNKSNSDGSDKPVKINNGKNSDNPDNSGDSNDSVEINNDKESDNPDNLGKRKTEKSGINSFFTYGATIGATIGACMVGNYVINKYGSKSVSQLWKDSINKSGQYATDYFIKPALVFSGLSFGCAAGAAGAFYLLKDKIASWYGSIIKYGDEKIDNAIKKATNKFNKSVDDTTNKLNKQLNNIQKKTNETAANLQKQITNTTKVVINAIKGKVKNAAMAPVEVPVNLIKGGYKKLKNYFGFSEKNNQINDLTRTVILTQAQVENLEKKAAFVEGVNIQSLIQSKYFDEEDSIKKQPPYKNKADNQKIVDLTKSVMIPDNNSSGDESKNDPFNDDEETTSVLDNF